MNKIAFIIKMVSVTILFFCLLLGIKMIIFKVLGLIQKTVLFHLISDLSLNLTAKIDLKFKRDRIIIKFDKNISIVRLLNFY